LKNAGAFFVIVNKLLMTYKGIDSNQKCVTFVLSITTGVTPRKKNNNMQDVLKTIKEKIANGASYNGTVYVKHNGKNWSTLSVYIAGQYTKIAEVQQKTVQTVKKEVEAALKRSEENRNEWLVDGGKVVNNLSYADMYNRYGMDFE